MLRSLASCAHTGYMVTGGEGLQFPKGSGPRGVDNAISLELMCLSCAQVVYPPGRRPLTKKGHTAHLPLTFESPNAVSIIDHPAARAISVVNRRLLPRSNTSPRPPSANPASIHFPADSTPLRPASAVRDFNRRSSYRRPLPGSVHDLIICF